MSAGRNWNRETETVWQERGLSGKRGTYPDFYILFLQLQLFINGILRTPIVTFHWRDVFVNLHWMPSFVLRLFEFSLNYSRQICQIWQKVHIEKTSFDLILADTYHFGGHWYLVLDFLWRLLWVSKPKWILPYSFLCGRKCNVHSLRSISGATSANLLAADITAGHFPTTLVRLDEFDKKV